MYVHGQVRFMMASLDMQFSVHHINAVQFDERHEKAIFDALYRERCFCATQVNINRLVT